MKKFLFVVYLFLFFSLIIIYFLENNEYNKINKKLSNISNVGYEEKIKELEKEYNKLISNIDNLTEDNITEKKDVLSLYYNLEKQYQENLEKNKNNINKKDTLTEQKNILNNQYQELVKEERKRNSYLISNVSKINQYSIGYPTGCESAALTILLNYWNVKVTIADVVKILPKGPKPYYKNGIKYGGNPYIEFIGDPKDAYSYGVYDIPIENVGNTFKNGINNGRGKSLNQVLELVKQNRPVIVWSSMNLGIPHYTNSWIYEPTGERINWLANLHAIVVIGYTESQVITTDSLTGTIRYFDKNTFENRYNAFGKRALYY